MHFEYPVNARKIAFALASVAGYFTLQSLLAEYLVENVLDQEANRSFVLILDLFSVNAELSIPTWFATLLLALASVLLAIIAITRYRTRDRFRHYWGGLALIFLYLSMDEGAVIHEIVADWIQTEFQPTGYLTFGWQLVAVPLVLLLGLLYLRFVLALPTRTRFRFILAGMIYLGGALVIEGISANQIYRDGDITFEYLAIATLEEFMEMMGIVVFIHALLDYLFEPAFSLTLTPQAHEAGHPAVTNMTRAWRITLMVMALIILTMNLFFVVAAVNAPQQDTDPPPTDSVPASLIDALSTENVVIARMSGRFGFGLHPSHEIVASLSASFADIIVISIIPDNISIALASDALPYDQTELVEILHANGEVEFIILDSAAVRNLLQARSNQ